MKKADFVAVIQEKAGCTKAAAGEAYDALVEALVADLAAGNATSVNGLGTVKPVQKKARVARNPRTGETVEIPAKVAVTFAPSKALKERVNG